MVAASTSQVIGWAPEVTDFPTTLTRNSEVDPISSNSDHYYYFGEYFIPFQILTEKYTYRANYFSPRNPNDYKLISKTVMGAIPYLPVNGISWYYVMGKATSNAGVHSIVGLENTDSDDQLPTFTYRWEDKGGDAAVQSSMVGCKAQSLTMTYREVNDNATALQMSMILQGIKRVTPTLAAPHNGLAYPTADATMGGTQIQNEYRRDTNMIFNWDHGGTPVSLTTGMITEFTVTVGNLMLNQKIDKNPEDKNQRPGTRTYGFTLKLKQGISSRFYDDFIAQTVHDMQFKIYQPDAAGNYLDLVLDDCYLWSCEPSYTPLPELTTPHWLISGTFEGFSTLDVKDGVDTEYYGVA